MEKIKLKNGRIENYTIVLSNRSHEHLGQLTGITNVKYSGNLTSAQIISFTVYKHRLEPEQESSYTDNETYQNYIWKNLVDFKLIWVKELDAYFQIKVSVDDAKDTTKKITATSLCEAELSQTMLYNLEINSELDISHETYDSNFPTVFYRNPEEQSKYDSIWNTTDKYNVYQLDDDGKPLLDEGDNKVLDKEKTYMKRYSILKSSSLLHRILDKVPHYSILDVDTSLWNLQRTFSIDNNSIYDFLVGECSEQFDCLFQFDSKNRTISAYDLMTVCKECGERGDFFEKNGCSKCGSKNLQYCGSDTLIFVDKNNLTDSIHLELDSDSIKNCFKLETGDDLMNATVRSLNPNGTDYLNVIRQADKDDMPKELVERLNTYEQLYNSYIDEYQRITEEIYNLTDDILYYESSMMPKVEYVEEDLQLKDITNPREGIFYEHKGIFYLFDGINGFEPLEKSSSFCNNLISSFVSAKGEADKLMQMDQGLFAIKSVTTATSKSTVNTALKNYASLYVKTGYVKIDIEDDDKITFNVPIDDKGSALKDAKGYHYGMWHGRFKVTNYSDKEDVFYTPYMDITITENPLEFATQSSNLAIKSFDDKEFSVFDVLSIDSLAEFKSALKLYSLNRLKSFHDALESALNVLISLEQANEAAALYSSLYLPYYNKLGALLNVCSNEECQKTGEFTDECPYCGNDKITLGELYIRQTKIDELQHKLTSLQEDCAQIQANLNLETYLGDLYPIFCSYRREDKYSNSNYISDGLDTAQLFQRAREFWELAKKDLLNASNGKITISSTLNNLLLIDAFKPLTEHFQLGNWIRVSVDGMLYRLRLVGYEIDFDNLQTINVTFSNVSKTSNLKTEIESIISSAQSMATNFGTISKQASKGDEANKSIQSIVQNGLNSGMVQIKNNENEEVTYDKHGLLLRSKDSATNTFDPKQCKFTHNVMAYTTDNWKTVSQVIGEHKYNIYEHYIDENGEEKAGFVSKIDYGVSTQFVTSGVVNGSQIIGGDIYSSNYNEKTNQGTHLDLLNGRFSFGGGKLVWDGDDLRVDSPDIFNEEQIVDIIREANVTAKNLKINAQNIDGTLQNNININNSFIVDADGKVTFPDSTTLPWNQITDTPTILTETDISNQIQETVTSDYINSLYETGVTGTYTIGDKSLRIVNGIIVEILEIQEEPSE